MPKRRDFPLGGMPRKLDRQQAERARAEHKRMVDRITEAFDARSRTLDSSDRAWRKALTSGRAPFPRRRTPDGSKPRLIDS
jgi:hypothetical protein